MKWIHLTFSIVAAFSLAWVSRAGAEDAKPCPTEPKPEPFIVGGTPVTAISELPWLVALVDGRNQLNPPFQFCGGALVAENWVLTAAHCVDNSMVQKDEKRLDVIGGTLTYKTGGERLEVEKIEIHPNWGKTGTQYDYDAALLKLKSSAKQAKPIAMMPAAGALPTGLNVRVAGWGAISEGGPGSDTLLFVEVPVVENPTCNKPESYDGLVSDQMFCAGVRDGGLDSCQGDSGGPVDIKTTGGDQLAGIVSWGFGCAQRLKYGVYTRVPTISEWASKIIASKP